MVNFLSILERVREGRTGWLWALPAITILWTNLHGGFLIGIVIVGAYAGGELLGAVVTRDRDERSRNLRAAAKYMAATAGCALASLVNPYGYHLHTHLLVYFGDPFAMKYILEFKGTNFQAPAAVFLEIMLILGLAAAVWYARRRQFAEVLLIAGFGHLSLVMVRNMPIYVIAAAPVIAAPMVTWLKALADGPIAGWLRTVFETFVDIGESLGTHVADACGAGGGDAADRAGRGFARGGSQVQAGVRSESLSGEGAGRGESGVAAGGLGQSEVGRQSIGGRRGGRAAV
jgi:hypothetical protein